MMGFGVLGMFLLWGAILVLLAGGGAFLFRQTTGTKLSSDPQRLTARQVLDERYALGEVSRDEYDAVRAQIER